MNNKKIGDILFYILFTLAILVVLSLITLYICLWIFYGGKPVSEIPMWVQWLLLRGGSR